MTSYCSLVTCATRDLNGEGDAYQALLVESVPLKLAGETNIFSFFRGYTRGNQSSFHAESWAGYSAHIIEPRSFMLCIGEAIIWSPNFEFRCEISHLLICPWQYFHGSFMWRWKDPFDRDICPGSLRGLSRLNAGAETGCGDRVVTLLQ